MQRFKKVILSFFLPLFFWGCQSHSGGGISGAQQSHGKKRVLSTIAQIGDLVAAIGGDRVDSTVLIVGDLDPHSYEMGKGDGEKLKRADLIFYNGLGLEHGASLSSFLRHSRHAIALGERIEASFPELILKQDQIADPHIWMDISLWEKGVSPIVEELSLLDPEGATFYQRRGELLLEKMERLHQELLAQLRQIPSQRRYLVTSHDAFHYFTKAYFSEPGEREEEDRFAAPEGLAPEGQLNARDLQKIIDYLKEKKIHVIFPESNVNRDSLRKIASASREIGLMIEICKEPLYGDAMSGLSYLEMMKKNGETIARHL